MKKTAQLCFTLCFLLMLALVAGATATNLHETVSGAENRSLAAAPQFSREGFLSGEYFAGWEDFLIDRAGGRNTLVKANTFAEMELLRLPVVNDIYVSDDFLLPVAPEKYGTYGDVKERAEAMALSIAELSAYAAENGSAYVYVGIPSQLYYYRNAAPDFCRRVCEDTDAISRSFFEALDGAGVDYVDVDSVFQGLGRPKDFYTVTDHHYSFAGAFAAYGAVMEKINAVSGLNAPALTAQAITVRELPNPFSGSRNRELFGMFECGDRQSVGIVNEDIPFERWDNGARTDAPVLRLPQTEQETVTYSVFMGTDYAETIIETKRPELPKLLLYGDSFSNALESLLYASFDEMRSLDLRYYTEKSLRDYIADYKPDVIICVRDCSVYLEPAGNGQT